MVRGAERVAPAAETVTCTVWVPGGMSPKVPPSAQPVMARRISVSSGMARRLRMAKRGRQSARRARGGEGSLAARVLAAMVMWTVVVIELGPVMAGAGSTVQVM